MRWLSIITAVLFLSLIPAAHSHADSVSGSGKIHVHGLDFDDPDICSVRLDGDLYDEEAVKLIERLKALPDRSFAVFGVLCLNSEGGDFGAAVSIINYLLEEGGGYGIVTYIPKDASCGSACALVFLAGSGCDTSGCYIYRVMNSSSSLWFHSPFNNTLAHDLSEEAVNSIFRSGINVIRELINPIVASAYDYEADRITINMLVQILNHEGHDRHYIDTLGKAIEFNVEVEGDFLLPEFDPIVLFEACDYAQINKMEGEDKPIIYFGSQKERFDFAEILTHDYNLLSRSVLPKSNGWEYCLFDEQGDVWAGTHLEDYY